MCAVMRAARSAAGEGRDAAEEEQQVAVYLDRGGGDFGVVARAMKKERPVRVGLGTDLGAGTSFSILTTLNEAYKAAQLNGHALSAGHAYYLATRGTARALYLDDKIGSISPGMERDLIVLDLKSTPIIEYRMRHCRDLDEASFIQMTMGDDRAILATYYIIAASAPQVRKIGGTFTEILCLTDFRDVLTVPFAVSDSPSTAPEGGRRCRRANDWCSTKSRIAAGGMSKYGHATRSPGTPGATGRSVSTAADSVPCCTPTLSLQVPGIGRSATTANKSLLIASACVAALAIAGRLTPAATGGESWTETFASRIGSPRSRS
jgi:hypothetical protein